MISILSPNIGDLVQAKIKVEERFKESKIICKGSNMDISSEFDIFNKYMDEH